VALFKRRQVWLPTWSGALLILALLASIGAAVGARAYALLAPTQPVPEARTLVVEGWMAPGDLRQAAAVARAGRYERVLTTGAPTPSLSDAGGWESVAARAAAFLSAQGLDRAAVIAVPAPLTPQDRTYVSAVAVRDWAQRTGTRLDAIDLVSTGAHTRRSWLIYRMAFGPGVRVGAIAVTPSEYDAEHWWTSSQGVKTTLGEILSLAWTQCCFWPAE